MTRHTVHNAVRKKDTLQLEGLTYYATKCLACGEWFLTRDKRQDSCDRKCGGTVAARRRLYGDGSASTPRRIPRDSKALTAALEKLKAARFGSSS